MATTEDQRTTGRGRQRPSLSRGLATVLGALVLLFAVSLALAPSSVSTGALQSMLPFASVLAILAIGQTLVVMQGGFDLSVPGSVSLVVVVVTYAGIVLLMTAARKPDLVAPDAGEAAVTH